MRYLLVAAALLVVPVALSAQHVRHEGHDMSGMGPGSAAIPKESGQSAFGAITEVVEMLEADPGTDWSKVDIGALRAHLVDMDNVVLRARVTASAVPQGMRFEVAGDGAVRDAIRRMATSHAAMTNGQAGQKVTIAEIPHGVLMTVTSGDAAAATKIRALGFFGEMAGGAHHQLHHLMMAKGEMH
jgi:hypothetical protein